MAKRLLADAKRKTARKAKRKTTRHKSAKRVAKPAVVVDKLCDADERARALLRMVIAEIGIDIAQTPVPKSEAMLDVAMHSLLSSHDRGEKALGVKLYLRRERSANYGAQLALRRGEIGAKMANERHATELMAKTEAGTAELAAAFAPKLLAVCRELMQSIRQEERDGE